MVYTSDMIKDQSIFAGDVEELNVATDMICEHYVTIMESTDNDDIYLEAGKGVSNAIVTFIDKIVEKVKEFGKKIKRSHDETKMKKQIEQYYSPEFRQKLEAAKKNKDAYIEDVDLDELKKVLDKSEKFIDTATDTIKKEIDGLMQVSKKSELKARVAKFDAMMQSLDDKYQAIDKEFMEVYNTKKKIPLAKIDAMAKRGINYDQEIYKAFDDIAEKLEEFKKSIPDAYNIIEGDISNAERANIVKRAVTKVSSWCSRHNTLCSLVHQGAYTAVYLTCGFTTAYVGNTVVKTAGTVGKAITKEKEKPEIRTKYDEYKKKKEKKKREIPKVDED